MKNRFNGLLRSFGEAVETAAWLAQGLPITGL